MRTVEREVTLDVTAGLSPLDTLTDDAIGQTGAPDWWQMVLSFFGIGG
jgi:hypothetical protein